MDTTKAKNKIKRYSKTGNLAYQSVVLLSKRVQVQFFSKSGNQDNFLLYDV